MAAEIIKQLDINKVNTFIAGTEGSKLMDGG